MEDKIVSYVYVSCCGSILSVGEERAFFCYRLLVYVVSFRGGSSSSLGGLHYLLWHSLDLPYNHFAAHQIEGHRFLSEHKQSDLLS